MAAICGEKRAPLAPAALRSSDRVQHLGDSRRWCPFQTSECGSISITYQLRCCALRISIPAVENAPPVGREEATERAWGPRHRPPSETKGTPQPTKARRHGCRPRGGPAPSTARPRGVGVGTDWAVGEVTPAVDWGGVRIRARASEARGWACSAGGAAARAGTASGGIAQADARAEATAVAVERRSARSDA